MHPEKRKEIEENTNIKLFQCMICTRMFGDKEDLNRHTYIHRNEKPFKCTHCEKGFNDKSNLRQHERTHVWDKKHVCELCDKAFLQKRDLRNHQYSCQRRSMEMDIDKVIETQGHVHVQVMSIEDAEIVTEAYDSQILPTMMETFSSAGKPVIVEQVKEVCSCKTKYFVPRKDENKYLLSVISFNPNIEYRDKVIILSF